MYWLAICLIIIVPFIICFILNTASSTVQLLTLPLYQNVVGYVKELQAVHGTAGQKTVLQANAWYCRPMHGNAGQCTVLQVSVRYCWSVHGTIGQCTVLQASARYRRLEHSSAGECTVRQARAATVGGVSMQQSADQHPKTLLVPSILFLHLPSLTEASISCAVNNTFLKQSHLT